MKRVLLLLFVIISFINYGQCPAVATVPNDACYQQVIAADTYCCNTAWDGICQAAYDACVPPPPPVVMCTSGSYVVESDDWENTNVDVAVIVGTTYGSTPQTHGPLNGSKHQYLNFVNGFTGLAYDRQFTVCADSIFELTCWMHDTWSGNYNVTIEVYDGVTLLNTQTLVNNGAYTQYSSGYLSSTSGTINWKITNNSSALGNNDFALDDLLLTQCNCSMLPIALSDWKAYNNIDYNTLKWTTSSEINNDYFTLERSVNGEDWESIHFEYGAGNSSNTVEYTFNDYRYSKNDVNFYRLSQTDFDGETIAYNVIKVDNRMKSVEIVKIVNYLGQEVNENYKGLRIITYSDGSVIKKMGE